MSISKQAQFTPSENERKIVFTADERTKIRNLISVPIHEALFTCCTKFYPDGDGGWIPVKKVIFDRPVYNPNKFERHGPLDCPGDPLPLKKEKSRGDEPALWKKSYNRARQACFDLLMCNSDLDTFLTFTVNPERHDARSYDELVAFLSTWLSNRVRRHGLKYILVPERHKSGAIHFHGIANREGLKLVSSGYYKVGKYTLLPEQISARKRGEAQEIYNVRDLPLGFSTAIHISGLCAQEKVSKYIWKYMTKQGGQKIGGRFYLHGGDLQKPRLEFTNETFAENEGGVVVGYGDLSCKIVTFFS